jgi:starch synthase
LSKNLQKKVAYDRIDPQQLIDLQIANYEALIKIAISYSDGLIMSSENIPESSVNQIKQSKKPQLNYVDSTNEEVFIEFYSKFF